MQVLREFFLKKGISFLYPALCLHCREGVESPLLPLCVGCRSLLELHPKEPPFPLRGITSLAVVFESIGPILSLVKTFLHTKAPSLAKGLAAWMALYWIERDFPLPDIIVPMPTTFLKKQHLGYHPAELLAKHLSMILHRPYHPLLQARWGYPSSSYLSFQDRKAKSSLCFCWKQREPIVGKTLLLVDSVVVSGASLKAAASHLWEGFPKAVYALTLIHPKQEIE